MVMYASMSSLSIGVLTENDKSKLCFNMENISVEQRNEVLTIVHPDFD